MNMFRVVVLLVADPLATFLIDESCLRCVVMACEECAEYDASGIMSYLPIHSRKCFLGGALRKLDSKDIVKVSAFCE